MEKEIKYKKVRKNNDHIVKGMTFISVKRNVKQL